MAHCLTSSISTRRFPARPFFFFNDTATTEIYTLSLHDALPISFRKGLIHAVLGGFGTTPETLRRAVLERAAGTRDGVRSEEHTSELQSLAYLVCRLLLEKKNAPSTSQPLTLCTWKSQRITTCLT